MGLNFGHLWYCTCGHVDSQKKKKNKVMFILELQEWNCYAVERRGKIAVATCQIFVFFLLWLHMDYLDLESIVAMKNKICFYYFYYIYKQFLLFFIIKTHELLAGN